MKFPSLLVAGALLLGGCANTKFMAVAGYPVQQGRGGPYENVNGVDFWVNGATPPRKFKIVGFVTDSRGDGALALAGRNRGIAAIAKQHGADAVIMGGEGRDYVGTLNTGNAYTTANVNAYGGYGYANAYGTANTTYQGASIPMYRRNAKYWLAKYL